MKVLSNHFAIYGVPLVHLRLAPKRKPKPAWAELSWADLQKKAAKFGTVLTLPTFENTPAEVAKTTDEAIAKADKALDAIGSLDAKRVTFRNTFRALDDIQSDVAQEENRIVILSQAHPDAKVREAAIEADQKFSAWAVGVDYRKDVYKAVKAFAATSPKLQGEDRRLFEEQLRDYRRAGLDLPEDRANGSRKSAKGTG